MANFTVCSCRGSSPLVQAVSVVLGATLVCAAADSFAADWSFDPKIALSGEYDDNNRLTDVRGNEVEVTGAKIDAELAISGQTPLTSFVLRPRLRSTFYPGEEQDEANDQFLRLDVRHEGTRLSSYLEGDYSRVVTLGSYFPESRIVDDDGLGNPPPGTGVGEGDSSNREDRLWVQPGVEYEFSERHSVGLALSYLDVSYDLEVSGDRQSYSSSAADAEYRFKTSRTGSVAVLVAVGEYEPEVGDSRSTYSIKGEWASRPTETAELYVRGGAMYVESTPDVVTGDSSWETGFSGGAGVRWKFEVTDVFLDANHYLDPNSSGDLVARTQVRAQVSRKLSPVTTVSFGARGIDDSGAPGDESRPGRKYVTADAGIRWRMTPQIALFGLYQYRWKERDDAVNDAQSNALSIGVVWEPTRQK
jgi:hypothetical protein